MIQHNHKRRQNPNGQRTSAKHLKADNSNQIRTLRNMAIERGMVFNDIDQAPFRARMAPVYATWKEKLGSKCWALLESHVGKLG